MNELKQLEQELEQELDLLETEIEESTLSLRDLQDKFHRVEEIRFELTRRLVEGPEL